MGAESSKMDMTDTMIQLKMTSKQLSRMHLKCEKEETKAKKQVKKAMESKNIEIARVYAENAIRKKSEGLNYLKMSSRVDGVASRMESVVAMQGVTKSMGSVVKGMERAMNSMNLEEMMTTMDKFEDLVGEADVREQTAMNAFNGAVGSPEEAVDDLLLQVAQEEHMAIEAQLLDARAGTESVSVGQPTVVTQLASGEEADLDRRLAALRG